MLPIGAAVLIGTAFFVGIPGRFDLERISLGQVLLLAGTAILTWALLNLFKRHFMTIFKVGTFLIGAAVLVLYGVYERDIVGAAGGTAIIAAWLWSMWKGEQKR